MDASGHLLSALRGLRISCVVPPRPFASPGARAFRASPPAQALVPWVARPGRVRRAPPAKALKANPRLARSEEKRKAAGRSWPTVESTGILIKRGDRSEPPPVRWLDWRGSMGLATASSETQDAAALRAANAALREELLSPSPSVRLGRALDPVDPAKLPSVPAAGPYFHSAVTPAEIAFATEEAPKALGGDPQELEDRAEMVRRAASLENASMRQVAAFNRARMVGLFGRREGDTGSSEVKAAVWTARIKAIREHLESCGYKDKHARRRLAMLESRRAKELLYLRRKNLKQFVEVSKALGVDPGRFVGL
ncbi:hypothetical protein DFJ74DRAFT_707374 [Hyaloraphidium curvatum]|nr:hypothetical protein DFJ74DRAFT_707374 [Hyaloraphidium curvatum]